MTRKENIMDNERKAYLEKLKKESKQLQKKRKIQNNVLLNECIDNLSDNATVLNQEQSEQIYNKLKKTVPFGAWGIDWLQFHDSKTVHSYDELIAPCSNKQFYIIWGKDLPIINCDIYSIVRYLDDISAVSPDTWLFSLDFNEVIELYHDGKITVGKIK